MSPNLATTADRTPPATTLVDRLERPGEVLVDLLDEDLAFETRSRNDLSSHLSMELVALHALGADDAELHRRFERYAQHLSVPREDVAELERRREDVWSHGIADAVRAHATTLVDSPATQWLHAPIRLAYAVEVGHTGQVANALRSWEDGRHPFDRPAPRGGDASMAEVLASLGTDRERRAAGSWDLVAAAGRAPVAAVVDRVRLDDATWDDLAATALAVFVAAPDFGSLHMVTGTHAARVLAPLLRPEDAAVLRARMAQALAGAHLVIGAPELPRTAALDRRRAASMPDWSTIHAAAVRIPDAHAAKLVYTATREHEATGDPLYRWVAARAAGMRLDEPS